MRYKLAATLMAMTLTSPVFAEDAVCYNCPPQWADWASMLRSNRQRNRYSNAT